MESNTNTPSGTLRATRAQSQYKAGYSRTIRILRLALPVVAILLIGIVLVWPNLDKSNDFVIEEQTTPTLENTTNELLNPRFESVDNNSQPYSIVAAKATQSPQNENLVFLESPSGDVTLKDGALIKMVAEKGAYEQEKGTLTLTKDIGITHDAGYTLTAETLELDFTNKIITSENDIQITGPIGTINAKGVQANGESDTLLFSGPATLTLDAHKRIMP